MNPLCSVNMIPILFIHSFDSVVFEGEEFPAELIVIFFTIAQR